VRGLAAVALLACVAAACGEPAPAFDAKAVQLVIEMRDYSVKPSVDVVKAGTIKIGIRNLAGMSHDLVVLKTDVAPDKLPYDGGRAQVIETGLVGKQLVEPQRSAALTVTLEPGSYVLICNVAGHYQLGMRAALKVEP
jgi:uncharacterized cupredoxin-like copper-binding protein